MENTTSTQVKQLIKNLQDQSQCIVDYNKELADMTILYTNNMIECMRVTADMYKQLIDLLNPVTNDSGTKATNY